MGITRMGDLKRAKSGARCVAWRKKRNFLAGRPASETRLGEKTIHPVRVRGGSLKMRALRLDTGTFAWASENATRKTRILNVAYHATSNEFVRTNTLARGSIVQVEAAPFKHWFERQYGKALGKSQYAAPAKVTDKMRQRWENNKEGGVVAPELISQFDQGRVLAIITSRPGQCGRADGYLLEGEELAFYNSQMKAHKK